MLSGGGEENECWWPIIVVDLIGDFVAVYCPGLAWQNSRPWFAHRSRVRIWLDAHECVGNSDSADPAPAALYSESPGSASDTYDSDRSSSRTLPDHAYDFQALPD